MAKGGGYVKLYRQTLNSRVFANEGLLKVWIWCLCKANHEKKWVPVNTGIGTTEVEVGPGQFIFGRNQAAQELKMKPSTVRNRIKKLKNMQNLDTQEDSQCTIITLKNWDTYQGGEIRKDNQKDSERTARGQREDTNKNVKNVKNKTYSQNSNGIPYQKIIEHLNKKAGKNFRYTTPATKRYIKARWVEGFRLNDFLRVIESRCSVWLANPDMMDYLRPQTLFGTKFESYLNTSAKDNLDEWAMQ